MVLGKFDSPKEASHGNEQHSASLASGQVAGEECAYAALSSCLHSTPSVSNYKSFQESWRIKVFQV